jgi:beta-aspartyl-peptidase (threonine type)
MDSIALIVHGGAGTIRPETQEDCEAGIARALERGWSVLESGGSSLDACEQATIQLEDDPTFNAGTGSHLNRDGHAQLDAILMDGRQLHAGAVGAVERVRNPIRLARLVLERSGHIFLVGSDAEEFGINNGLELCDPKDLVTPSERQRWEKRVSRAGHFGTVGAVALDRFGNLSAGTSTGGTFFKHPGRVGDSPLIGCGCYADNLSAGVSSTGHGESIMRIVMAKTAADLVENGRSAQEAADKAVEILTRRTSGTGGLIVIDRNGRLGVAFSTPHMTWAGRSAPISSRS